MIRAMDKPSNYIRGFLQRCEEANLSKEAALALLKQAGAQYAFVREEIERSIKHKTGESPRRARQP
jgi:hypothetical protein